MNAGMLSAPVPRHRHAGARRLALSVLLLAILLPAATIAATYPRFQADMRLGREQVAGSTLITTPISQIEYAETGSGPAVLMVHGAGGGFDQGLLIGQTFVGEGYRLIAPSRFGYLRSEIPANASPELQADVHAALLDALSTERVAVVAYSDGGPSALQFALRHPDRTAALVMMSAKSQSPPPGSAVQEAVFESIFRSDYLYWAVNAAAHPFLLSVLGVPAEVQGASTGNGQRLIAAATDGMNPISQRRNGIYLDRAIMSTLPPEQFPLEQIMAPTLVVHAQDDSLQPYAHGLNTAGRIPGAQLVSYERGGHLLLLQIEDARQQVAAFIAEHLDR
ncbi:MAG: alpha/beta fold hydrolase [Chloroflexota bacterium]